MNGLKEMIEDMRRQHGANTRTIAEHVVGAVALRPICFSWPNSILNITVLLLQTSSNHTKHKSNVTAFAWGTGHEGEPIGCAA